MKTKLLTLLAAFIFLATSVNAANVYQSKAETKRIPKGTKFQIQLQEPIGTKDSQVEDYFSAILLKDEKTNTSIVLPAGSLIRGTISNIKPAKRVSKGAVLYLDFDHVVTPRGRQMPLEMSVYATMKTTFDGGLYDTLNYGEAMQNDWETTKDITVNSVNFAADADVHGIVKVLTVPVCAIGGVVGSTGYILFETIADIFKKGTDVTFNQGDVLTVVLTNDIDIPVN